MIDFTADHDKVFSNECNYVTSYFKTVIEHSQMWTKKKTNSIMKSFIQDSKANDSK